MLVVLAALTSAVTYGSSDFLAALAARRGSLLRVTTLTYLVATALLGVLVLAVRDDLRAGLAAGAVAGVLAVVGLLTFYAALAAGPMGVLSPVIAMLQAAVPVGAALLLGERLTTIGWVGVAFALAATALLGSAEVAEQGPAGRGVVWTRRAVVLALVSGVTLGLSVAALDRAPAASGLAPAFVDLAVGLVLLAVLGVAARTPGGARLVRVVEGTGAGGAARGVAPLALGAGALMAVAQAMLMVALQNGDLAVVAVLVGLYPMATVLLARLVLGERLGRRALVGVGAALAAGVLLGGA